MRYWILFLCLMTTTSSCVMVDVAPGMRRSPLKEEVVVPSEYGWFTHSKIALITLSGEITGDSKADFLGSRDSSVIWIKDQLKKAEEDPQVKAVVLRIDSPGGDVTASDIIYRELKLFRQKREVPVLASIMDVGASGGYYVALAADQIYVHPTSITGSIGVVAQVPRVEGLSNKIGFEMRTIKSGQMKDLGSIWRAFRPGEEQILQNVIDQMFNRFVGIVAENRPNLDEAAVRRLADGRIYTAQQAKDLGLVDDIKYLDQVIELAKAQAGLMDAYVVAYKRARGYRGNIYAEAEPVAQSAAQGGLEAGVQSFLGDLSGPKVQYIWKP